VTTAASAGSAFRISIPVNSWEVRLICARIAESHPQTDYLVRILEDDLTSSAIRNLLREHLDEMHAITPPESMHALDPGSLRAPDITFWSAWDDELPIGCGALKELDSESAEIKSMRTVAAHRGQQVASRILEHLLEVAARRGSEF
jgi:putative acetyltransferase